MYTKSELEELSQKHPIIAFDGVCNLCDGFVSWLIKRDKKKQFRYITLQSQGGDLLLKSASKTKETVVLAYNGEIFTYSDVGLQCMKILGSGWSILSYLSVLPKSFRDMIYHYVAKNRYRWFGKKDACMIPTPDIKELFL